jgi:hypothetical protein
MFAATRFATLGSSSGCPLRKLVFLPLVSALAATICGAARADETASTRSALAARGVDRPYTMAQLGVGVLTLPGADVCLKNRPCTKGDTSIAIDFWQMYRANRSFAIGAGGTVALVPTTDNPPSEAGIERSHTRSYYMVEAQGRYYAVATPLFEAWLGATAGVVVVSDRYSIDDPNKRTWALIGPLSSSVGTEGATVGGLLGAEWSFAPNWAAGFSARYMRWFLPHEPATTVFLDRATLTDQQSVIQLGISCSYRIAL